MKHVPTTLFKAKRYSQRTTVQGTAGSLDFVSFCVT